MIAEVLEGAQDILARYPDPRAAIVPLLHLAQARHGYLTDEAVREVADLVGTEPTDVLSVASFYHLYSTRPKGEHLVQICTNVSCMLRNGEGLFGYLKGKLGIGHGETTPDGRFTLLEAECLGYCDIAPMMLIGDQVFGHLTEEKIDEILAQFGLDDD